MDSFNNDKLKFDWLEENYAEIDWMETSVSFINGLSRSHREIPLIVCDGIVGKAVLAQRAQQL